MSAQLQRGGHDMAANVIPFPKPKPVVFDPDQRLHRMAALIVEKLRRNGCECTFEEALGNCRAAVAQIKRELVEREAR